MDELLFFFDDAHATLIEDGYQNSDNTIAFQEDQQQFNDDDGPQTIIEDGYQNSDYVAPNSAQLPAEPDVDWSEPLADYQFNHFTNSDQPGSAVLEETWQDEDVEHPTFWWVDENGYASIAPIVLRQEGDDDSILAMDDVGEDITNDITRDDAVGPDVLPPITVIMPDLIGMSISEAQQIVASLPGVLQLPAQTFDAIAPQSPPPKGMIIWQLPLAGSQFVINSTVVVGISSGLTYWPNMSGARTANPVNSFLADDTPP